MCIRDRSMAHERYRQTDRQTTDGRQHIANVNVSSRSLKIDKRMWSWQAWQWATPATSVSKWVMQLCRPPFLRRWENQHMLSIVAWTKCYSIPSSGVARIWCEGAQNYMKLYVAHKMIRNNRLNMVHVAATELPQLLWQKTNMFGQATAQSRSQTFVQL